MAEQRKTILVVDDDPHIRLLLHSCFKTEGYTVLEAGNADEVDGHLNENKVDLVTLDLNLGAENGLDLAEDLRMHFNIPFIIVTGKGDVIDRVVGLELGADDYVSKPFHVRELLARVRSVIRRSAVRAADPANRNGGVGGERRANVFCFSDWKADLTTFALVKNGSDLSQSLTTNDFKLLAIFLKCPKQVLSRDQITDRMNGHAWTPPDRTIDNQVARLRKKIESDPADPKIIKTVRGVGYVMAVDVTTPECLSCGSP